MNSTFGLVEKKAVEVVAALPAAQPGKGPADPRSDTSKDHSTANLVPNSDDISNTNSQCELDKDQQNTDVLHEPNKEPEPDPVERNSENNVDTNSNKTQIHEENNVIKEVERRSDCNPADATQERLPNEELRSETGEKPKVQYQIYSNLY